MDPYPSRCAKQFFQSRHSTAWQLIKSYWQSDQRFPAYLFFTIVMVMTVSLVGLYVVFNYWYNYYYDVLQAYDDHGAVRLLIVSSILIVFYLLMALYNGYISQFVEKGWRRWLMNRFAGRWLQKRGSCRKSRRKAQNRGREEEHVKDEITALINFSIDFSMELIGALTAFIAFCYYLWLLTGDLNFTFGPAGAFNIPSYIVWLGLICSMILFVALKRGRSIESERRQWGATSAGPRLQKTKVQGISRRFVAKLTQSPYFLIFRQKILLFFAASYAQAGVVLPLVIVLPGYFDKVFLISWLIQYLQMFAHGRSAMSQILHSYPVYKNNRSNTVIA